MPYGVGCFPSFPMLRAERISIVLSTVAVLCSLAALAAPMILIKTPSSARLMRLAGPLEHFSDKQFDAVVRMLDRGAKMGSKMMTDEALAQIESAMDELETETNEMGGDMLSPTKQLADARNAQRRSDVNTLLNAVYQYAIDNNGSIPKGITEEQQEVCTARTSDECSGMIDLSMLLDAYLVAIPRDPQVEGAGPGSRYLMWRSVEGFVTVSAPDAERGATISVTR